MRNLILILTFIMFSSSKAQTEVNSFKQILDTSIVKAKELSLYSDNVDWKSLEYKM